MTETTSVTTPTDQTWWTARFRHRYPEAGPPLFRRRSNAYRRLSRQVEQPLPPQLAAQLAEAGPECLHELFLAALAGVLYRYQGGVEAEGIVVGSPRPGDSDEIGPEVLPLLVNVTAEMPFTSLRAAAATSIAESHAKPDCSVAVLLDTLGMGEVTNRHPLFPVVLCVRDYQPAHRDLRSDVTVMVSGTKAIELEYNGSVHGEATIMRLGRHVTTFLAVGLANPDTPVRAIHYLPADERTQLLDAWSGGAVAQPDERSLHELVEAAVRAYPDREAIVFDEQTITYGELDARANQLANHLRGLDAGPGSRVGLCLPASAELLIGVLGVLKSGAAVVPLVPTFPVSRNRMTIDDSAMDLVVANASLSDRFTQPGPVVVCLDRHADEIARAATTNPRAGVGADDPVYVLFTSGSTGRPRGVVMAHRTLVNLVWWQRDHGPDPAGRRTLQRTSIGFDVSFQEIFSTLAFGGCLVVAPDEVRDDVSLLPEFIERHGIARVFLPPVALDQMAVTATLTQLPLTTLKEVIVSGEQLQISMPIRRLFHQLDCSLDNQYGPTETHVVTAFVLDGPSTRWSVAPPIGKPIRNVRAYVLDPWLQPVPTGVPGEIFVGGIAPALGYLTEEDTAGHFHADPFVSHGVIYQTGDRARFLADGDIEFLGRSDDQVKIRGYRIELGEVEANLLRIPGIHQAAVAVHESETLGKQLAAYVVADGEQPDAARIRQFLLEELPGHMVPAKSSIVHMAVLPKTPTGKVDRRALPPPPRPAATSVSPHCEGSTEQTVAKLWAQALELERVGHDDNFIELGGHSLIGIQIVAQINDLYSIALPLRSLLRGTTVAAVAGEIDVLRRARAGEPPTVTAVAPDAGTATEQEPTPTELPMHELDLPNGRRIICLQPAETRYLFADVFEYRTYDRGGIRYPEIGCVFDVGAHVGLFTLYALERSPGLQIFAFEPCPPLFAALRRNTEGIPAVRRFPFGLADHPDTAQLTFYPNLTGMSSFHPDQREERALLTGILKNLGNLEETRASTLLAESAEYLDERLLRSTYTCERRTLSDVLAQTGTEKISLLKIDVQKAEMEVLGGIAPADWAKIEQLAIEVHDLDGQLYAARSLLAGKGYRVTVEQDPLHAGTAVHFVYAVREY